MELYFSINCICCHIFYVTLCLVVTISLFHCVFIVTDFVCFLGGNGVQNGFSGYIVYIYSIPTFTDYFLQLIFFICGTG